MAPKDVKEASVFPRPAPGEIRDAWYTLFSDPLLSLANLKGAAAAGLGAPDEDGGILLRSVYWRFYLGLMPPPTSLDLFPAALATARKVYNDLRERYLVAPDGRWASDCSGGEGYAAAASSSSSSNGSTGWDPLSLDGDSPWKTWFAHVELRETIRQDVDRTFPDIPYFSLDRVRRSLTTMLFLFSVLNPDVGYRQGMHELLAVCLIVVDRDSLESSNLDPSPITPSPLFSPLQRTPAPTGIMEAMSSTLDRSYIEHDAFGLFLQVMRPAKSFYEWRTEEGPGNRLSSVPQAPILVRCNHIQGQLLRKIDPQLSERFEQEGVEAQIWAIRWIRLILTRELPFPLSLRLWDGIFAEDPGLGILDFVCIAMLLLIRNELIEADYGSILTHLLHYPAPSPAYPFNPSLILAQANFLQHDVSPTAGVEVVIQNQDLLGIKVSDRSKIDLSVDSPTAWRPGGLNTPPMRPNSARDRAKVGVTGIAQGLFERAQKAGLDKAFADFRNNLPDATSAYAFLPSFSPVPQRDGYTASPTGNNPFTSAGMPQRPAMPALHTSESTASIKSMLDAERQMAEMRLVMLTMGKAMSSWMDTLKDGHGGEETKAEAWAGLDRIRDSLLDAAGKEADEMMRDWAWNDDLDSSRSQPSSTVATPVKEAAAPTRRLLKTPTLSSRSGFDDEDGAVAIDGTPKQMGKGRSDIPPAIPIATINSVPQGPSTARPGPTGLGLAGMSADDAPPATSPAAAPELMLSRRDDRPVATLTRVPIHSPRASVALPNADALARAVSPSNTTPKTIVPPPRTVSISNSLKSPIVSKSATPASSDPLAGLNVGSSSTTSKHERRRSAWRLSATSSVSGSGSASGSETVGRDPLGASG